MKHSLAAATITGNALALTVQGYVTFESPASRYGHYEPDLRQLASDPFVTSRCATRDGSAFPGAAVVWSAGTSPCVTLKEVGPFESAAYKVTLLDAAGVPVHVEDFAAAPLGNRLDQLHQTVDTKTGLPVFEWCDHDHHDHHRRHDRDCIPRNDLVVAKRRLMLTLPKDLASCKDCTLQLAAKVDGGAQHFACANVDVVESDEVRLFAVADDAVCESEPAELTRYKAAVASVWALNVWYSLWKWTAVTYLIVYILVLIIACGLGHREKKRLAQVALVQGSSDALPVYDMSEQTSKNAEAGVTDPEAPEANLVINSEADDVDETAVAVHGKRGQCRAFRRGGNCGHGKCEPSALRVGLQMNGPRCARGCMRGVCALLSIGYILAGIAGGLMILHYQA